MKNIICILSLAIPAFGQNVLVNFYPPNQPIAGLTNYPAEVRLVSWATNSPGWATNWTTNFYATHMASLAPIYKAAESNATWQAQQAMNTNIARLLVLYNGIPAARTDLRNFANATNTLTTAQLTTAVRQIADYEEKLMEFVYRLGPVLKELYKPENDPINPVNPP